MIFTALLVALGLVMMFLRLSWRKRIWLLSNPLLCDVFVFVALTLLHWGSFNGVIIAGISAFFISLMITAGRRAFGYAVSGEYQRGMLDISTKL